MTGQRERGSRIAALDGIRCVAVVLVFYDHLVQLHTTGWYGVDLFFALSGFLITTILLAERGERHFWRMFYVRRITRILPPFLFILVLSSLFAHVQWKVLWPWVLFSLSNVAILVHYPEMSAASFGIFWSLSVEEHFYLLWPFQVRRLSRRTLAIVVIVGLVVGPLLRALWILHHHSDDSLYYLTPFHLDGILLGSLLALGCSHPPVKQSLTRVSMWIVPLEVAIGALVWHGFANPVIGAAFKASLIACATALIVAYVVLQPHSWIARVLSLPPLPWLGQISYGLYLYHQLIWSRLLRVAYLTHFEHPWLIRLGCIVLSIALAWLSFAFMETPLLRWGRDKARSYREEAAVKALASSS